MARLCMAKGALTEDDLDRELGIPAVRPGLDQSPAGLITHTHTHTRTSTHTHTHAT